MTELVGSAQDISPVLRHRLGGQISRNNGNGIPSARRPGESEDSPDRLIDVSEKAVREELEYILENPDFKAKPMIAGFLSHVVEETLAGKAHQIKGYTIATQVFGRRKDFDPAIDPIVRIQAGRLRRALENYYSGPGRQDHLKIEIAKGSYVPIFSLQMSEKLQTGESHQFSGDILTNIEVSRGTSDCYWSPQESYPSITVVPIINLTNDPDQECTACGLTEELMSELGRCHGFRVSASPAAIHSNKKQLVAQDFAGRTSDLGFLLEGSIRKQRQTFKFTFRLIHTATATQIWEKQYKRDFATDHIIDLQERIARSVAGRIRGLFGSIRPKQSENKRQKAAQR